MRIRVGKVLLHVKTRVLSHSLVFCMSLFFTAATLANPVLDNVAAGNATVDQTATTTIINQTSDRAILNWQSFNIGGNESTHFNQPMNGVALNRINASQGASQIYGSLTATGQIILINPAGVYFAPGSFVNVGGLIATTANISNQDFLSGYYNFNQASPFANASITNAGQIIAANNGLIALVGGNVTNSGLIQANVGHVILASGNTFVMNFDGSNLINFAVTSPGTRVTNTGSLIANGGQILVSAKAASGVLDNVINLEGIIQAKSVYEKNGVIIISGDLDAGVVRIAANMKADKGEVKITGHQILLDEGTTIDVSGEDGAGNIYVGGNYKGQGPLSNASALVMAPSTTLLANAIASGNGGNIILWSDDVTKAYGHIEAKGGAASGDGGFIETSSKNYLDVSGLTVDTSAPHGEMGTWLLDPLNVTITLAATTNGAFNSANPNVFTPSATGSNVLNSDIVTNLGTANVIITTGSTGAEAGNITVGAPISGWGTTNKLTLSAANDIIVGFAISDATAGARVTLIADNDGSGTGTITGLTGAGSITLAGAGSRVDLFYNPIVFGTQDPIFTNVTAGQVNPYMLVQTPAQLQSISGFLGDYFGLTKDLDMTGFGNFIPLGNYTGKFHGNGHLIEDISITSTSLNTGLFSTLSAAGEINSLGISGTVSSSTNLTGTFVGINSGVITDSYSFANTNGLLFTGGIAGRNTGTITRSFNTGNIAGSTHRGGITGENTATGVISFSYNSGTIDGISIYEGGLVGFNDGSISNSYNTGTLTSSPVFLSNEVGGLVGHFNAGSVTNSYNSGLITGNLGADTGGLFGVYTAGTSTNNFWDTVSSTRLTAAGSGAPAGTTPGSFGGGTNLSAAATYTGWSISNTISATGIPPTTDWFIFEGLTRPMLMMEYQTDNIRTPHALQLAGTTLANDYKIAGDIDLATVMTKTGEVWNSNSGAASGQGFVPIGNAVTNFTGTMDGQIYDITGLYINRGATQYQGLFGSTSGANLQNLVLKNVDITAAGATGSLVGYANNSTSISNSAALGKMTNTNFDLEFGGLVGRMGNSSLITSSYADVNITSTNSSIIGGLVGLFDGPGTITNSYATGNISTAGAYAGGLIGYVNASGTISIIDTYASGYVTGSDRVGGLIGHIESTNLGAITNIASSYSIGRVTGSTNTGGFIGLISGAVPVTTTNDFWNTETSGQGISAGTAFPKTSAEMRQQATYTGWDYLTVWNIIENSSYPFLRTFYTNPRAIAGIMGGATPGDTIKLANNGVIIDTGYAAANSAVYFLEGINLLSGIGNTIADGDALLLYNDGGAIRTNVVASAPTGGGSLAGVTALNSTANTLTIGPISGTNTASNALLIAAKGALTDTDILYSITGADLGLSSGVSFTTSTGITYTLAGNITTTNGSITLNGPTIITVPSPILMTNTTGDISIIGDLDGGGNALTLNVAGTTGTIAGAISNLTTLTKSGAGTITLAANDRIGDAIALTISSGTLGLGGFNDTVGSIVGPGTISLGAGTLTAGGNNNSTNFSGVITGSGGFTKAGTGITVFSNLNSYTGTTTINSGILRYGIANAIASTSAVNLAGGTLQLNGFNAAIGSLAGTSNISIGANTLTIGGDGTSTSYSGIISGTGGSVTKTGAGVQALSGANTYTGTTTIAGGTLQLGAAGVIADTSAVDVAAGTFDLNGNNETVGSIEGGGTIALGAGTLTAGGNNNSTTVSGIIGGTGGFTKTGSGTTTFSGANTYSGTTTISSGAMTINSATGLGAAAGSTSVASGATLNLNGVNIGAEPITLTDATLTSLAASTTTGEITLAGTANIINSTSGLFTLGGNINGGTALTLQGAGTFAVSGGSVGNTTPLTSLLVNSASIIPDTVTTTGSQTYNALITTTAGTTLTSNSAATNSIALNVGVTGNNGLNIVGNAAGNLTFTLNDGNAQTYTMTGTDDGTFTATGVAGGTLTNVQNLTSSSGNDFFTLAGGTLSGSINAAGGSDTLIANNVVNTFNITSTGIGTLTGIGGTWSSMENLTGGTAPNTFIFANNATITGLINGGTLLPADPAKNTLNFNAYTTDLFATFNSGTIFDGVITNPGTITTYTNINNLLASVTTNNIINPPTGKAYTVTETGFRAGYIGDPTFYDGWIIAINSNNGSSVVRLDDVSHILHLDFLDNDIADLGFDTLVIKDEYSPYYDRLFDNLLINPYCATSSS